MPETQDVTITVSKGGVFSTGNYENEKFGVTYSITRKDIEQPFGLDQIDAECALIAERLTRQIEHQEQQSHQKYIQKLYKDIRFHADAEGNTYPSVTSIINSVNPIDWKVTEGHLRGLSARGTVGDSVLQHYIEKKEWLEPAKIPECFRHLKIMQAEQVEMQGNLPAFVEKFKVKFTSGHREVFNHEHKYSGEPDAFGTINDDTLTTLFDLKWFAPSADGKVRVLKQMAAYANACEGIEQICVIPINGKNQCGYSKPIYASKDKMVLYFKMFLDDRAEFEKTFGV